jgi:kumamolisin
MLLGRARWFLGTLLVLIAAATAYATKGTMAPDMARLPGHVLPALARAAVIPVRPGDLNQQLNLTIVLKRDDQAGFERYLHGLYDPHSKNHRHFLTQRDIANRFGPSQADYDSVLAYLQSNGFKLVQGSANRLTITVTGTRAQADGAFETHIRTFRLGRNTFYANDLNPALPIALFPSVQAIAGLSDWPRPHSDTYYILAVGFCRKLLGAVNIDKSTIDACYSFVKNQSGYNGPEASDPPGWEQLDGTGQTIGLVEFDNFQRSDVANFLSLIGASATEINNLTEAPVSGGAQLGPNEDEVLLDIDTVMAVAPGAKVVVYDAPFSGAGSSFQAVFNAAINGDVTVISNSWAYCEDQTTLADAQSIDSLLQNAAASGISVFNGAGDSGSTCLDGSPNTVAVPADSPNGTAVGGSSLTLGPGNTYGTETWWNGINSTPPTGQGGYGVSKFFPVPSFQAGLVSGGRSVPDLVADADPADGVYICQADKGGCPSGLSFGGTSMSAPAWAAFAALINQALGKNLGAFNSAIYPFANTSAFHNAASMNSSFAQVGLGSPNLNQLYLELSSETNTTVSPTLSALFPYIEGPLGTLTINPFADGTTQGFVDVRLIDENGNPVGGKTITLEASPNTNVEISPASAVSSINGGIAVFTLTDLEPETLTLTATDTTDNIQITPSTTPTLTFVTPPAASASISAAPGTVANDGTTQSTISITLEDSLGRPVPGKQITLQQTGNSVVNGPTPGITNSSGEIQFAVGDQVPETVTYTATDVTDGNLPVPGSTQVSFTGNPSTGCGTGSPPVLPGFLVTPYATGCDRLPGPVSLLR